MKKVIITTGENDSGFFEESFETDEEILAYLEGERAGGNRWIKVWVQDHGDIFKNFEDPSKCRAIPAGAISKDDKRILRDEDGEIIGHYRVDCSSPIRVFYMDQTLDKKLLEEDPNLRAQVNEILEVFNKGWNHVQGGKEVLERWGIRVERDVDSLVYYQEYSLK